MVITLLFSCSGKTSAEKTISEDQLQERNGVYYEVNEKNPFSGTVVEKYSNGKIQKELHYKVGERDGTWTVWNDSGQKMEELNYRNGQEHGRFTWWSYNGQKTFEVNYTNGQKHGLTTDWHENGQKKGELNYKDGELVSAIHWDENGNETK